MPERSAPVRETAIAQALAAVQAPELPAGLFQLAHEVVARQADGKTLYRGVQFVHTLSQHKGLDDAPSLPVDKELRSMLERGAQRPYERAMVAAFAVRGFDRSLDEDAGRRRAQVERFVDHAEWLELSAGYVVFPFVARLARPETASAVFAEVADRVRSEAGGADRESPDCRARNVARLTVLAAAGAEAELVRLVASKLPDVPTQSLAESLTRVWRSTATPAPLGLSPAIPAEAAAGSASAPPPAVDAGSDSTPAVVASDTAGGDAAGGDAAGGDAAGGDAVDEPPDAPADDEPPDAPADAPAEAPPLSSALGPAVSSIVGRLGRVRRSSVVEALRLLSGWALLAWLLRSGAYVLRSRTTVRLALVGQALQVDIEARLLGWVLRVRRERFSLSGLTKVGIETRFRTMPLYAGLLAVAAGLFSGAFLLFDGVRSGELNLLLLAFGVAAAGVVLDLGIDVLRPAWRGSASVDVKPVEGRALRVAAVDPEAASDLVDQIFALQDAGPR